MIAQMAGREKTRSLITISEGDIRTAIRTETVTEMIPGQSGE